MMSRAAAKSTSRTGWFGSPTPDQIDNAIPADTPDAATLLQLLQAGCDRAVELRTRQPGEARRLANAYADVIVDQLHGTVVA